MLQQERPFQHTAIFQMETLENENAANPQDERHSLEDDWNRFVCGTRLAHIIRRLSQLLNASSDRDMGSGLELVHSFRIRQQDTYIGNRSPVKTEVAAEVAVIPSLVMVSVPTQDALVIPLSSQEPCHMALIPPIMVSRAWL